VYVRSAATWLADLETDPEMLRLQIAEGLDASCRRPRGKLEDLQSGS
jgi:hypothetical protein